MIMNKNRISKGRGIYINSENNHHEIMPLNKMTKIGTIRERIISGNSSHWKLLNKINNYIPDYYSRDFYFPLNTEIRRLLYNLDLFYNNNFKERIFHCGLQIYDQFPFHSHSKNSNIIAPLAIYIFCLRNFIFIQIKKIYKSMKCNKKQFIKGLKEIYQNNKEFYKEIHSDNFRISYIYSILMGIKNHFNLRNDFLIISKKMLLEYFNDFKNRKDTTIALFISAMVREFFSGNLMANNHLISKFLGVEVSILNNNKELWNLKEEVK